MVPVLTRYKGRHRQSGPSFIKRGKVILPTTAVVAGAVAAGAVSTANGATYATGPTTVGTVEAVNSWTVTAQNQSVSRSATRASAAVDAKVRAAVTARAKAKTAAQTRAKTLKATAKQKAAVAAMSTATTARDHVEPPKALAAPRLEQQPTRQAATGLPAPTQQYGASAGNGPVSSTARAPQRATGAPAAVNSNSGGYVCPIAGCAGVFTSGFGYRNSPGGIGSTNHGGIDLSVPVGTPLRSMSSGTVTAVGWYGGQGMRVNIDFGNGVSAVYAHMSGFAVSPGQQVAAGQMIGWSGNTGNSTGPHLHLEIHIGGVVINPYGWLSARGLL